MFYDLLEVFSFLFQCFCVVVVLLNACETRQGWWLRYPLPASLVVLIFTSTQLLLLLSLTSSPDPDKYLAYSSKLKQASNKRPLYRIQVEGETRNLKFFSFISKNRISSSFQALSSECEMEQFSFSFLFWILSWYSSCLMWVFTHRNWEQISFGHFSSSFRACVVFSRLQKFFSIQKKISRDYAEISKELSNCAPTSVGAFIDIETRSIGCLVCEMFSKTEKMILFFHFFYRSQWSKTKKTTWNSIRNFKLFILRLFSFRLFPFCTTTLLTNNWFSIEFILFFCYFMFRHQDKRISCLRNYKMKIWRNTEWTREIQEIVERFRIIDAHSFSSFSIAFFSISRLNFVLSFSTDYSISHPHDEMNVVVFFFVCNNQKRTHKKVQTTHIALWHSRHIFRFPFHRVSNFIWN